MKGDPPSPQFFKCQSFHSNAVWNKNATTRPTVVFEYFDRLIVACNTSPAHWHIEVLKDNDFWMFEPPKNWMFLFPETTAFFLTAFTKVNLVSSQRAFWSCFYSTLIQCWCVEGEGGHWINPQIFLCVFFEHVPS